MDAMLLAEWAIAVGKRVLTQVLLWFQNIIWATGLAPLWSGAMVFVAVFSILLIPLRGGADLTKGAIGRFAIGRINRSKPTDHQD